MTKIEKKLEEKVVTGIVITIVKERGTMLTNRVWKNKVNDKKKRQNFGGMMLPITERRADPFSLSRPLTRHSLNRKK